ncbi:MAG: ABC transporter permease [Bryobacteraceae bacterium]|nr:ABC transporter permease [Bryobacteraceae bacterium]
MRKRFELFVAARYLRAKRKQAVISLITAISILGVAAGVMALVIALAINNGFRNTLQRNLLGATAHVTLLEKEPMYGIENWRELTPKLSQLPHVSGAWPTLYGQVFLTGPARSSGAILKGLDLNSQGSIEDLRRHLKQGSIEEISNPKTFPGLIVGSRLAESTGIIMGQVINVISPQGEQTPFGPRPSYHSFRVVGIFESGFFELDSNWAFTSLPAAQKVMAVGDVANAVEMKLDDIYRAPEVSQAAEKIGGPALAATNWMEQNKQLLGALRMERVVTVITIGLIQLVAALNILITLVMMVMEKQRDIAILVSMGARQDQIRRIFVAQGVLIGVIGTAIGLIAGYTISYFADRYRWIHLDEQVYSLSFVPFEPRWPDGIWVAATAIFVSFIATLYPARTATRIAPAEALRYE